MPPPGSKKRTVRQYLAPPSGTSSTRPASPPTATAELVVPKSIPTCMGTPSAIARSFTSFRDLAILEEPLGMRLGSAQRKNRGPPGSSSVVDVVDSGRGGGGGGATIGVGFGGEPAGAAAIAGDNSPIAVCF